MPRGDDETTRAPRLELGQNAVPAMALLGLEYPPGFAEKCAKICGVLGELRHPDAVPALLDTLRDPVVSVAAWACFALEQIGDRQSLPALRQYHQRLLSLRARAGIPAAAGSADDLIAQSAKARLKVGDASAETELLALLLSPNAPARATARQALHEPYGAEVDVDPAAEPTQLRAWVERWQHEHTGR